MMRFRTIKAAIISILGAAESGRYRTVGFQRQVKHGDEALDSSRLVQVYYSSGDFSKSKGRLNGPTQHDISYRIDLTVSKAAEGDVSTLNDPGASASAKQAALAAFSESAELADDSFDELVDIVYQVLMDARNLDLGQDPGVVSNKWLDNINKDQPEPQGDLVVLTGSLLLRLSVAEQVEGEAGTAGEVFDITVDINGDDTERGGVAGDLGG